MKADTDSLRVFFEALVLKAPMSGSKGEKRKHKRKTKDLITYVTALGGSVADGRRSDADPGQVGR